MNGLRDMAFITLRHLRNLSRQPWYIALSLMQPIIYLFLFGSLFQRVAQIPGFGARSYVTFLAPGLVVMSALFSGGFGGFSMIEDLDRGVIDRLLVAPMRRSAIIFGKMAQIAVTLIVQSTILITLAWLRGASFDNGAAGIVLLVLAAILLAMSFSGLSMSVALLVRKQESVIATVNGLLLPLTFLSSLFMASELMPSWMQHVARYNPVNWAVQAGRDAVSSNPDWVYILSHLGYLVAFTIVCAWLAIRAFRSYQRSV